MKKKISESKLIFMQDLLIPLGILLLLIILNVFLYQRDLYTIFSKIETLGLLWTIVGFAFTIYCFILPKLSKKLNVFRRLENVLGHNEFVSCIDIKEYLKLKRTEIFLNLLRTLLFAALSFLIIVTFTSLHTGDLVNATKITINISANLILTMTFSSYLIILYLSKEKFDVTDALDEDKLEELRSSIKEMEAWKIEANIKEKKETKNGKDEDAK